MYFTQRLSRNYATKKVLRTKTSTNHDNVSNRWSIYYMRQHCDDRGTGWHFSTVIPQNNL